MFANGKLHKNMSAKTSPRPVTLKWQFGADRLSDAKKARLKIVAKIR